MKKNIKKHPSSFRDPSGFIFADQETIFRQINQSYQSDYQQLMNSGLYQKLVEKKLLVTHQEIKSTNFYSDQGYKIIQPQRLNFISYPYEWCFGQLKAAALATLQIQKTALNFKMSLKDASSYNLQFLNGQPIFIDTLSFEKYSVGQPWVAYRQFCQHFVAPLALMKYKDLRLNQLFRIFVDGVPLDLASSLLPFSTKFKFSLLTHLHLHAKSQKHFADKSINKKTKKMNWRALRGLIDSLENTINNLELPKSHTEWGEYYSFTNYSPTAFEDKKNIIKNLLKEIRPKTVWDLGANDGLFSRLASQQDIETIAFDIDLLAVEKNYRQIVKNKEKGLLPLFIDLTNPIPSLGWQNQERASLLKRGPAEMIMALALIHHFTISNNTPFVKSAEFFSQLGHSLIIEFIPKNDSKVQKLLATREDIFSDYNQIAFENAFKKYFLIKKIIKIKDSNRIIYLMEKK